MYVNDAVVLLSTTVPKPPAFDTCSVYVSPVPLHVNVGVVSFVSALSTGLVWLTVTHVSINNTRAAGVSKFPASSLAITRQKYVSAAYPPAGVYVVDDVVLLSTTVPNPPDFDTCSVYVSPVPLHANVGVVSFVSALSTGLARLTVTLVSMTSARAAAVSWFPASSLAITRQKYVSAPYPLDGAYVVDDVVLLSTIAAKSPAFDTCSVYVSPVPLHVNVGVVSFVSALSAGLARLTVTPVSITRTRDTVVS